MTMTLSFSLQSLPMITPVDSRYKGMCDYLVLKLNGFQWEQESLHPLSHLLQYKAKFPCLKFYKFINIYQLTLGYLDLLIGNWYYKSLVNILEWKLIYVHEKMNKNAYLDTKWILLNANCIWSSLFIGIEKKSLFAKSMGIYHIPEIMLICKGYHTGKLGNYLVECE